MNFEVGDLIEVTHSVYHNACGDLCIIVAHVYYPDPKTWFWLTYNQINGEYVDMLPDEMRKL